MNSSNIYIPNKINIGYQYRKDTYTGKLGYVIYFDEKGKLRKEASWNNWRDDSIVNDIYENVPTEGFVLNKKVGGVEESWGYDPRKTYTRVYDPRGFEFEITIPNLLWILENCNCIKGKGLEGEFVYGWQGKDLVLVPVDSPDYKSITENTKKINKQEYIKPKDFVVGYSYVTKNSNDKNDIYVYLGRFDKWETKRLYGELPDDLSEYVRDISDDCYYKQKNLGKHHWFVNVYKRYNGNEYTFFYSTKYTYKMVECVDNKPHEKLTEYLDKLNHFEEFSPVDYKNVEVKKLPQKNIEALLERIKRADDGWSSRTFKIYKSISFDMQHCKRYYIKHNHNNYTQAEWYEYNYDDYHYYGNKISNIDDFFKDAVYLIYKNINGIECKRKGWYNEDGTDE